MVPQIRDGKNGGKDVDSGVGWGFQKGQGYDGTQSVQIELEDEPVVGSELTDRMDGVTIPVLDGRVDPRTYPPYYPNAGDHYMYIDKLAVNGRSDKTVEFKLHQRLRVEDLRGNACELTFEAACGECYLMKYRKLRSSRSFTRIAEKEERVQGSWNLWSPNLPLLAQGFPLRSGSTLRTPRWGGCPRLRNPGASSPVRGRQRGLRSGEVHRVG